MCVCVFACVCVKGGTGVITRALVRSYVASSRIGVQMAAGDSVPVVTDGSRGVNRK